MLEQEFYYDQTQALSENLFTLKGWQYIGWMDDSTGEGKKYTNKEEISNLTDQNNVVINLYVDWSNNEYLITYDSNRPKSISEPLSGSMETIRNAHYTISVTSRAFVAGQTATTPLSFSKVYNAIYDKDVVITAPEIANYTFKYFRYLVPLSDMPIGTINPPPPVDYYDNPLM